MGWSQADIPALDDRVAVVTGANGGLGLATAEALAVRGAQVVMATRNQDKAAAARRQILAAHPDAALEPVEVDLGSLASVEQAAETMTRRHDRIDILVANAGVMAMPEGVTEDGFETHFGVNHLGHWALVSHLLPTIVATPGARVVTVTSFAQHACRGLNASNPHLRGQYDPWAAYAQSKFANRLFAVGLDRRFRAAGVDAAAMAASPGLTHSNLQARSTAAGGAGLQGRFWHRLAASVGMSPDRGAMNLLRAATDPRVRGGVTVGPLFMTHGPPVRNPALRPGLDAQIQALWHISEHETGLEVEPGAVVASA